MYSFDPISFDYTFSLNIFFRNYPDDARQNLRAPKYSMNSLNIKHNKLYLDKQTVDKLSVQLG